MKYRKMRQNEIVKKGDEFFSKISGWVKSDNFISNTIRVKDSRAHFEYRRPIKEKKNKTRRGQSLTRASISTSGRLEPRILWRNGLPVKINFHIRKNKVVGVSLAN